MSNTTIVPCVHCGHQHTIRTPAPIGKVAKCSACGQSFTVTEPAPLPVVAAGPRSQPIVDRVVSGMFAGGTLLVLNYVLLGMSNADPMANGLSKVTADVAIFQKLTFIANMLALYLSFKASRFVYRLSLSFMSKH